MTPRVSIILPSKHRDALSAALANIEATTRGDYEVILVAPDDVAEPLSSLPFSGQRLRHAGDAVGPIATQALGVSYTRGDYVLAFADDAELTDGWDDAVVAVYEARAAVLPRHQPLVLGLGFQLVGTVFGYYYANWPFVRRATIAQLGWYDAEFKRGFGDCDLSLRAWEMGGRAEFTPTQLVTVLPRDQRKGPRRAEKEDVARFVERWEPRFGHGWPTAAMEDFNVNLRLTPDLAAKRTIETLTPQNIALLRASCEPPTLVDETPDANVVRYGGWLWNVPKHHGPIDIEDPEMRKLPGITRHAIRG